MQKWWYTLSLFCLFACEARQTHQNTLAETRVTEDTSKRVKLAEIPEQKASFADEVVEEVNSLEDTEDYPDEYATYYITIADTGNTYFPLRKEMLRLHQTLKLPIDTMGRYFDVKKNMIVLPENDEDEMFAGDYYPRRAPDASLSLEYLSLYQKRAGENTMALVTGIYEKKASADSALTILQKKVPHAFEVKSKMYIGCIH